ncbi:hypothetical protein [Leisingera sp. ANG-M7]|uniref:hypothetical protein n=1 Tax=Leisingera sp. ANG-M7 TaxID=1577902 RepID=UPI00057EFA8E|nr:hypothetical protein [Leisingera sp. ANG-M7]KIC39396.1 hypothetical protein RA26_01745 [Leisingera sp. ANG-M7]
MASPEAIRAALADKDNVTVEQVADSLWFNPSKMDGPIEGQKMIEVAGDALARSGALEKLGIDQPETFESVTKAAQEELAGYLGVGLDAFTARVAKVGEAAVEQSKFLVAGKTALLSVGNHISKVARQLDAMYAAGKIDPEVEAKLLSLMETHTNLQGHLKQVQTAAARAVSVGRIRTQGGIDGEALAALDRVQAAGGSDAIREAAKRLRMTETPSQQAALLRSMERGGFFKKGWNVVNEVFINNILSGWKTHAVNVASNTVNSIVLPFERIVGGALTGSRGEMRAGLEQYVALRTAVIDGLRFSSRVMKNEAPVLDTQVKLDYQNEGFKAISASNFSLENTMGGKLVDGLGQLVRVPGRFLMAEDEFFKQIMFRSRLKAKLTVDAASMSDAKLKRLGYDSKGAFVEGETEAATYNLQTLDQQWRELVAAGRVIDDPATKAEFIRNNLGAANEGSTYARDALRIAREATFTTPLAQGTLSHAWQRIANQHPYLRQVTPFIQTPVNILNKAFDRIPGVNLARPRYRQRLTSAEPAIRAEAAGEMATGVAITTALYMLALEGRITGGGPVDGKRRQMWMRDGGWQPYSFNVGTPEAPVWVEYRRMDPFAFTLGIAGDMAEMVQAAEDDPSLDHAGLFAMAASSVANNLTSKTWLQGISEVVEVLSSKDRPYVAQRWMETKITSLIPFSSAGRTFNQSQDDYMKEARGFIDKAKANIPGMTSNIPDRHNWVTGEAQAKPEHLLGFIKVSRGDNDLVAAELRRLNYGFTGPDRRIGEITFSTQQYQDWNRLMGTVRIGSKNLKQRLEMTMRGNRYDLERDRTPDGLTAPGESHRVDMIRGVMSAYKQRARAELFDLYPELYDAWRAYERSEADAQRGKVDPSARENLILKF